MPILVILFWLFDSVREHLNEQGFQFSFRENYHILFVRRLDIFFERVQDYALVGLPKVPKEVSKVVIDRDGWTLLVFQNAILALYASLGASSEQITVYNLVP